ncbi:hypothetical protein PV327_008882 [Microctonus hyperodae]|uniref:Uncharacterized protein n=1 Tax=Microctonus hyperodae TaxID=165561 RepID=A0AA39FSM8_MICHY|nr:hypothetical protein PV327_008882 [Microctonus hyperodae]
MFIEGFCIKQVLLQHLIIMYNMRNVYNYQCSCIARCSNKCKHFRIATLNQKLQKYVDEKL